MIKSKNEFNFYLDKDKKALGVNEHTNLFNRPFNLDSQIWQFQKQLRKCEYIYNNSSKSFIWKVRKYFSAVKFKRLSSLLGFTINPNSFGYGLRINHRGTIVVHGRARIGNYCIINACVNIGAQPGHDDQVPEIGDNVYIGPGAKIYGKIYIANNCIIGANAVVNRSCYEEGKLIVGVPAVVK